MKTVAVVLMLAVAASCVEIDNIFRGKPYIIVSNEKASWYDAASFCTAHSMQLCSIDDEDEFTYVRGQITARGLQNDNVWIGGTEIGQEDNYYWINTGNFVELDHWDIGEVVNPSHKCMLFLKGMWRHGLCSSTGYFVCETAEPATTEAPPSRMPDY